MLTSPKRTSCDSKWYNLRRLQCHLCIIVAMITRKKSDKIKIKNVLFKRKRCYFSKC
jgi:hypothetical protein